MTNVLKRLLTSSSDIKHEFGALNTLLLTVILGLCVISAYLVKQNKIYFIPESAAAICVGLLVGSLAKLAYDAREELDFLTFEPELFFFLLLPPIIFEAGYSLRKREFFANFWTICLYAVFGTIVSTFVIGYLVYFVGLSGLIKINKSSALEPLIFGALISSVDPVATLSIMGNPELSCDPLLYSLVFGESVLNDAVAIVLFKTFAAYHESGKEFSSEAIPGLMLYFTVTSIGSIFVGLVFGLICSYLCKHTQMKKYPEYEIAMIFLFAYGSFSFAESVELSGIMALFVCSVALSHYNSYNLSATSQVTAHYTFKCMSVLSEFFVFLYIGMGFFTGKFKDWNFTFILVAFVICVVARLFNIFPFSAAANLFRSHPIPLKMQVVMWFAGLRGAISFALSLNMPGEHKDLYVTTTLSLVIFTTIGLGGFTERVLTMMGMKLTQKTGLKGSPTISTRQPSPSNQKMSVGSSSNPSFEGSSVVHSGAVTTKENRWSIWRQFDRSFMVPLFGGPVSADDPDDGLPQHEASLMEEIVLKMEQQGNP